MHNFLLGDFLINLTSIHFDLADLYQEHIESYG